jgi:DNA end-binding protein Ku
MRAVWKGAISFGLVHVPVALYPATEESEIDFDWLDKRSLDPVGYKRVNKRTGKEMRADDIVKGVKQDNGEYVVLGEEEIRAAYPKTTQTIEIEAFVPAQQISFVYLERPYYVEPAGRSEKAYALLREAMAASSLIGIARLVMHTKEHLAAVLPAGPALMLGTLRWANEVRPAKELKLPPEGRSAAQLKEGELEMAVKLIEHMSTSFDPLKFEDRFSDAVRTLVARKVEAGEAKTVEPLEDRPAETDSNVVELTELLRNSLTKNKGRGALAHGKRASARDKAPRGARKRAQRTRRVLD